MNGRMFRLGSAMLMVVWMAGCASMQGGTSGVTSDEDIALDVGSRLREDSVTRNYPFGVDVVSGVVYLQSSATVGENVKVRAANIAAGAEGVRNVVFGDTAVPAPAPRKAAVAPVRTQPVQKTQPKQTSPVTSKKTTTTAPAVARPSSTGTSDDPYAPVPMK